MTIHAVGSAGLAALVVEALNAPRQCKNLNLHPTLADPVQRLLNACESGTDVRPHRRPPGMAGVLSAKPSVNEASYTGQTQGPVLCHSDPGKWDFFAILRRGGARRRDTGAPVSRGARGGIMPRAERDSCDKLHASRIPIILPP